MRLASTSGLCLPLAALALCLAMAGSLRAAASEPREVPYRAPARIPDALELLEPSQVRLEGFLGQRVLRNEQGRLLRVEEEPILAGFRRKPGSHPWIGEHVGKWMHAASLAYAYTRDPALRTKLDRVAAELIAAQEPDGYLGTYTPDKRFGLYPGADWDVWSHKYNLLGLLSYHRVTGSARALEACRKMGDLLLRTFGPGRKSILSAGTHMGMAATSVLEPIVLLYRSTGDRRYLDFARYIVDAYDEPGGPAILKSLQSTRSVQKTANGKAYEMMSNLVGLCELARATGERRYLEPAVTAWEDIVHNRLYITGTTSAHEHFQADHSLPYRQGDDVGETCATVTWMQLNFQLLRLTGHARYANQLERTVFNHLAGAQRPDGAQWCYFTPLEGTKPYGPGINCCVSSGPRGMALAPQLAYGTYRAGGQDGLAVGLYETSRATVRLGGQEVEFQLTSTFPLPGVATLRFRVPSTRGAVFGLRLRVPPWAAPFRASVKGVSPEAWRRREGWLDLAPRRWRGTNTVTVRFGMPPQVVAGSPAHPGLAALQWGPFVLAFDAARNPGLAGTGALGLAAGKVPFRVRGTEGGVPILAARVRTPRDPAPRVALFVPFAEAGTTGARYQVWLQAAGTPLPRNLSLLAFGRESRSRRGNVEGSIADGDLGSFVVTFDGRPAQEDWFAVELEQPVTLRRVVFAHGSSFHDGGWFDTSQGKPRVQIRRSSDEEWETVGALESYPAATATDSAGLRPGDRFMLRLAEPVRAVAVRVVGKPAQGDNPAQSFSSCAELQAYPE